MLKETKERLAIQAIQAAQGGPTRVGEALLPVFDANGKLTAYERHMAPERIAALQRNTHLGEMIGAWAGRQAEEELSQGFNRQLVDRVWDAWEEGRKAGRASEFVDLSDPKLKDPIQQEAWKVMPAEMQDYISEKFGKTGFMVRREMVNNAVGYREASVADAWTGLSRQHEQPGRQSQFDRQPDTDARGPIASREPLAAVAQGKSRRYCRIPLVAHSCRRGDRLHAAAHFPEAALRSKCSIAAVAKFGTSAHSRPESGWR